MADEKNPPQDAAKDLSGSFTLRSISRKERVLRLLGILAVSVALVLAIFSVSFSILNLFPEYVPISTANDLLKIMIDADGILIGFVGIIFAQLFSSMMDQQNVLYQSVLDKGDITSNKRKSLEFLDYRRNGLAFIAVFTFLFLLFSIFLSMSIIAKNSKFLPTDTYASFSLLFGPLLYLMLAVVLLMVAFVALPMRPPLEKTQK